MVDKLAFAISNGAYSMNRLAIVAIASLASMASATAQTPPPSSVREGASGSGKSLSSKLSESNGVITPKADVDPGIHVPAPDPHPNSTPVVPPAATGGGTAK